MMTQFLSSLLLISNLYCIKAVTRNDTKDKHYILAYLSSLVIINTLKVIDYYHPYLDLLVIELSYIITARQCFIEVTILSPHRRKTLRQQGILLAFILCIYSIVFDIISYYFSLILILLFFVHYMSVRDVYIDVMKDTKRMLVSLSREEEEEQSKLIRWMDILDVLSQYYICYFSIVFSVVILLVYNISSVDDISTVTLRSITPFGYQCYAMAVILML